MGVARLTRGAFCLDCSLQKVTALCSAFFLLALTIPATAGARRQGSMPAVPSGIQAVRFSAPILFVWNAGQAPRDVRFAARSGAAEWLFTRRGVSLLLSGPHRGGQAVLHFLPLRPSPYMSLVADGRRASTVNYLLGQAPCAWQRGIAAYSAVRYRGVYPGIDLVFQGQGQAMEYSWIVAPNAHPAQIRLAIRGAAAVSDRPGAITIRTSHGTVRQLRPVLYQRIGGRRRRVSGRFVLDGHGILSLRVGRYDRRRTLVVDPRILSTTILSGSLDESANAVAVDSAGNVYVAGATRSDDFPVQAALQSTFGGETDAFVAKLSPAGKTIWSTYLGGNRYDAGAAIAVDSAGDVFVTGGTESKNFPTTAGAFQTQKSDGTCPSGGSSYPCEDAFVAKLDPTGGKLLYSTFLGGQRDDWVGGIALDATGDVIVAGATNSSNFPTLHAVQPTFRHLTCGQYETIYPCHDAFVAKLNATGSGLLFSTFLGGKDDEGATAVALGPDGTIAVTGYTYSTDFPVVHGMRRVQRTKCSEHLAPAGRCPRAFVASLSVDGSHLLYSSYLGGSGRDFGNGIAVDRAGALYVVGETSSADFPTVRPVQPAHHKGGCSYTSGTHGPCPDAFITKLNPKTGAIVYSSHIGGTGYDGASAVAVDAHGDAFVAGYAGSYNFPTLHAVQRKTGGGEDAMIFALTPAGNRALFSTYLGGEHDDEARSIALGNAGDLYVAGETDSPKFPHKIKYGNVPRGEDAFVVHLQIGTPKPAPLPCKLLFGDKKTGCIATPKP